MASTPLIDPGAANALRAYERSRLKLALLGFTPALLIPIVAMCVDGISLRTMILGTVLFAAGVIALWRGQDAGRGVGVGVLAGLIPLATGLVAPRMHVCTSESCMTVCASASTVGGIAAGVVVGLAWRKSQRSSWMLIAAAAFSILTGTIGCGCVGYLGISGMAAGFALSALAITRWTKVN